MEKIFGSVLLLLVVGGSGINAHSLTDRETPVDYSQHQKIQILPSQPEHAEVLRKLEQDFEMDYWNPVLDDLRPVLTLVNPEKKYFLEMLNSSSIQYKVLANNFQALIDEERNVMNMARASFRSGGWLPRDFDYENYHTYEEILAQVKSLASANSDKAQYLSVGTSYEGREIPAVKIGNSGKVIFFECGIHSREWVTVAFGTWVINELLTNSALQSYVNKYQIIVVPVLNVDGYAYTHTNNRLWRKTRSRQSGTSCLGADPNRNWDSAFCQQGSSSNPCSETYCGKSAFSEVEAKQMSELAKKHASNTLAYFSIHSYSQLWMYPYGYTYNTPSNAAQLKQAATAGVNAIKKVNNLTFKAGPIASTIYLASGSSIDYVYDSLGIKQTFALELRDTGAYGFQLPANQIKPASLETWAGLKAAIDTIETMKTHRC